MSETDSEQEVTQRAYEVMMDLWGGQLIYTATELGMLDCLTDGPKRTEELARQSGSETEHTYRLLRALAYHGVLEETPNETFALTEIGECFLTDHPTSLRADLRFARSPEYISAVLHFPEIIQEGYPNGFVREFDRGLYEYAEDDPGFEQVVSDFMTARLRRSLDDILAALEDVEFNENEHVCDVGGGQGYLLARLLDSNPTLKGTVLDLPEVVSVSGQLAASELGVQDRCEYVGGDMFDRVPTADSYLLKEILHNWDDTASIEILSTIHDSAPPDARLLVIEGLVPGPETSHYTKQLDMVMMTLLGGRERTEAKYEDLLERAGWAPSRTISTPSNRLSILTAAKV